MNHDLAGEDFRGLKEFIRESDSKSQQPYNENFVDTFSKPEKSNLISEILVYTGCVLVIGLALTVAHYRSELKASERTINILKADNERLLHSSHNPFVHARK